MSRVRFVAVLVANLVDLGRMFHEIPTILASCWLNCRWTFCAKIVDLNMEKTDSCRNMQINIASETHATKFLSIICHTERTPTAHSPSAWFKEMRAARVNEMSNGLAPDIDFRLHS